MTIAPKTAEQALDKNSNSIAILKKEAGADICNAFLSYIITDLIKSFNVGKTMDTNQVVFVVNAIEEDYYYLRPEELKYCFTQAKKGAYGTTYDRIDAQVIYEWINKYLLERQQVCYDRNIEENKLHNSESIHPVIAESLKKFFNEKEQSTPVDMNFIEPEKREKTEQEIFVQESLKEFDKIWADQCMKDQRKYEESVRVVFYQGKRLDQNKFLEIKILQHAEKTANSKTEG